MNTIPIFTLASSEIGNAASSQVSRRKYKILLVNPTRSGSDSYISPPMHLVYVAQAVVEAGHDAKIVDLHYEYQRNRGAYESLADFERQRITELALGDMDFVGVGGIPSSYHCAKDIALAIKRHRPEVPVIIGGNMSMPLIDYWHKARVDYLVESDGELPIRHFLAAYPDAEALSKVPGLYVWREVGYHHTRPELPKNLDYITRPNWRLLDNFGVYMEILRNWTNRSVPQHLRLGPNDWIMPIVMTRGCPYQCTFCYHVTNRYRKHSVGYMVNYLKELKTEYGVTHVFTWDDLIMVDRHWLADLCDALVRENLGIKIFTSGGKPDLVTRDVLKKMKAAGFLRVSYGIESGSQEILDLMKKKATVEQNHDSVVMAQEEGLFVHLNMIVGMPGETFKTLRETAAFLAKLARIGVVSSKNLSFSFATGYPGTELYEWMLKKKIVTDTEEYLRNQEGLGSYKYNLCGISQKVLLLSINLMFLRVDLNHYLHLARYWDALSVCTVRLAKALATFVLPWRMQRMLRALMLRNSLLRGTTSNSDKSRLARTA